MSTELNTLITKAIRALPAKSAIRAELSEAMKVRADYAARGRKAAATRAKASKGKKARKPTKH